MSEFIWSRYHCWLLFAPSGGAEIGMNNYFVTIVDFAESIMHQSIPAVPIPPPPPGNRGAFAHDVSPGGEAFAILSRLGSWAFAYPGVTPGHFTHVFSKVPWMSSSGKTRYLSNIGWPFLWMEGSSFVTCIWHCWTKKSRFKIFGYWFNSLFIIKYWKKILKLWDF